MIEQERLSQKILKAKSEGESTGVPSLPDHVLHQNPWQLEQFEFNLLGPESSRDWFFITDNVKPAAGIWRPYDTKNLLGMQRARYNMCPPPTFGAFKLHKYTAGNYNGAVYWLMFSGPGLGNQNHNIEQAIVVVSGPSGASTSSYMSDKGPYSASTSGHCNKTFMSDKGTYGASSSGPCNKTFISDKGTEAHLRGVMDVSDNHSPHSSLLILSRALRLSGKINADDAVRATLSSIAWDTASLPSEDSVSELRRKLQDEYVQGARVLEQQDDLCKLSYALALLASTSLGCREHGELLRLLTDEKATEVDEVSYALMEKNFEKELFGDAFQLLDRDGLQAI